MAGYCVGDIDPNNISLNHSVNILINASNGASDYGNKIGEPIIGGFTRSYKHNKENIEWIKPIMFSAGIGSINRIHLYKDAPKENMHIIRIGGPAYKIGLGGGFSSSLDQTDKRSKFNYSAVQRGDPQMGNKLNRVISECCDMGNDNPIVSIHDQGAGGLANVVKEIVYPNGGTIYLDNVTIGDESMQPLDIWCSEFQESDVILVDNQENVDIIETICKRENICCDILGTITNSGKIVVYYKDTLLIDLPLKEILEPNIQKKYHFTNYSYPKYYHKFKPFNESIEDYLKKVLGSIDVCSKRFLTNKVDRSVSGKIVQQQCVGPFQTPISNYSLVSLDYTHNVGIASSIGERPILGITNPKAQGSMSVGEMITNMMGVYIGDISNIKCSANWMWPLSQDNETSKLYEVANEMCNGLKLLGIGIDGGKDSLSMSSNSIKAPGELVITGYAPCPNIYKKVTPDLKKTNSVLLLIDFSDNNMRIGHSIFHRTCLSYLKGNIECPTLTHYTTLSRAFNIIQEYIYNNKILALHDISDGGVITTLSEMAISSNIGIDITNTFTDLNDIYLQLFNEELGVICEIEDKYINELMNDLYGINYKIIGYTNERKDISIWNNKELFSVIKLSNISYYWEKTSYELEKFQTNNAIITYPTLIKPYYYLPKKLNKFCNTLFKQKCSDKIIKVAIIREEGSNGDKEMCAAFKHVGFDPHILHMNDLLEKPEIIRNYRGIVYVGGFSHSDVLGASHGWYLSIKHHKQLSHELDIFLNKRTDTFSLGVCNGCQLMVKQSIFSNELKLVKNDSERFESHFSIVQIKNDNNIFFKNMKNMVFGIWIAHGEGKFINTHNLEERQKVMQYIEPTGSDYLIIDNVSYPYNPNGSENGLAGICSKNGRHLGLMPHPERCFLNWQLPYTADYSITTSPWLMLFKNIYDWC